jgi:hypothetical protein
MGSSECKQLHRLIDGLALGEIVRGNIVQSGISEAIWNMDVCVGGWMDGCEAYVLS